ncbi:hypothetical protein K435DRAFT_873800 [Dendrothele bispora CBS 962.96]|uniref:Uncharacterized protein n=1 Tax=Dendrothele bispora (strain CBS 962.96) TaxID=1314807 RepID=A0A4S8KYA0_DENBC|nr:hypothetical protein K435DRAFT_873800 [Dendrothele bispora CBS 962.96]
MNGQIISSLVPFGTASKLVLLLDAIFFLTMNATTLHFAFSVTLSKLYTNSLYATPNSRASFE